jgi:hypothetical protein
MVEKTEPQSQATTPQRRADNSFRRLQADIIDESEHSSGADLALKFSCGASFAQRWERIEGRLNDDVRQDVFEGSKPNLSALGPAVLFAIQDVTINQASW